MEIHIDKDKITTIEKLPPFSFIKRIRSFLGHVSFYRRFVKDFSVIARPMMRLMEKDTSFEFNEKCMATFLTFKNKLEKALIIVSPDWGLPFELMCDASNFTVRAGLGQR